MAVPMPDETVVPPGGHRDLLVSLHKLYREAGRPGARRISQAIRQADLSDVVSHETVNSMLKGSTFPRWSKLEAVVRILGRWSVAQPNEQSLVLIFHKLWEVGNSPQGTSAVGEEVYRAPMALQSNVQGKFHGKLSAKQQIPRGSDVMLVEVGKAKAADDELIAVELLTGRVVVRLNASHPVMGELTAIPNDLDLLPHADVAVMGESMREALQILFLAWGAAMGDADSTTVETIGAFQREWAREAAHFFKGRNHFGRPAVVPGEGESTDGA
ncbi:hypothetical protein ACQF36_28475 [Streptomyces sp. Marseille-Q5077]|uniref:hypothetical protein n=1 Tax=Streptomyces sp. Marseille-Q5077 TaxID=3418995 RepID=UPI003D02A511